MTTCGSIDPSLYLCLDCDGSIVRRAGASDVGRYLLQRAPITIPTPLGERPVYVASVTRHDACDPDGDCPYAGTGYTVDGIDDTSALLVATDAAIEGRDHDALQILESSL